jgi:hypothetical protein
MTHSPCQVSESERVCDVVCKLQVFKSGFWIYDLLCSNMSNMSQNVAFYVFRKNKKSAISTQCMQYVRSAHQKNQYRTKQNTKKKIE